MTLPITPTSPPTVEGAERLSLIQAFDAAADECRRIEGQTSFASDVTVDQQSWFKRGVQSCAAMMRYMAARTAEGVTIDQWPATPPVNRDDAEARARLLNIVQAARQTWGYPIVLYADDVDAIATVLSASPSQPDAGVDRANDEQRALWKAVEPWKGYDGELPEYDHPLRCVFESGIQYAVVLLAKELGVEDWTPCDGTEEFDGDLGGTMMNIVCASLPEDEHGDRMHPSDVHVAFASPVDGGEVERREAIRREIINTPETADFMAGVPIEAVHQRERWGSDHDAGKTAFDWFWLVGYLAQKAASSAVAGDVEKAKHHTISTAAALANWHAAISGADTSMRPGIEPPAALASQGDRT